MTIKDIKTEARKKLALNMHQAIAVYTVEFTLMITLIALIVLAWLVLGVNTPAAIVMMCYGVILTLIAVVGVGMANFAMVDFYLASYRCKQYNIRRLGETLARSNVTKIFLLNLERTAVGFLLLLCLIVPGVIYLIRTSMANFLLIANPKMSTKTAVAASNKVMSGKTGAYFSLCMSLMGWYLLGVLTLGLGFMFILPYTNLIKTVYYKRNLQGDKAEYIVQLQPVSPAADGAGQAASPQQPASQTDSQTVMPIDTLGDDDYNDMKATMRNFNASGGAAEEQQVTVPEVPIMPIAAVKSVEAEPVQPVVEKVITHSIDGTNIVETERTLTTNELEEQEAAQKQALDGIYSSGGAPKRPVVDYFSHSTDNAPDDFVTQSVDANQDQTPVSTVIDSNGTAADDTPIISDSDFDAFLREFDNETLAETKAAEQNKAQAPQNNRPSTPEQSRRPAAGERRAPPRRPANGGEVSDRAERIRREREERLKNLKK